MKSKTINLKDLPIHSILLMFALCLASISCAPKTKYIFSIVPTREIAKPNILTVHIYTAEGRTNSTLSNQYKGYVSKYLSKRLKENTVVFTEYAEPQARWSTLDVLNYAKSKNSDYIISIELFSVGSSVTYTGAPGSPFAGIHMGGKMMGIGATDAKITLISVSTQQPVWSIDHTMKDGFNNSTSIFGYADQLAKDTTSAILNKLSR